MSSRMLRTVRSGHRTTSSPSPLARRLPLVAAAVVVAGLATACGPSAAPAGSAARAGTGTPAPALPADGTAPGASAETSATASAPPSPSASASSAASAPASASAAGASPGTTRGGGSATGSGPGSGGAKPASAAPAPAKVPGPGYEGSADARALIDAALRAAKSDGRMVLLDFGANWCGNCKAADKVFAQPATTALLADGYHLVKVDIGGNSSANSALLRKYSPSGGTYTMPVLVVVSPSGSTRVDTHATGNPPLTADGINTFLHKWAP